MKTIYGSMLWSESVRVQYGDKCMRRKEHYFNGCKDTNEGREMLTMRVLGGYRL